MRFVEEILLLLLRDEGGKFVAVPGIALDNALAGGVLMDLALENRIDTDPGRLILVDPTPVGDSLLDPTLAAIAGGEQRDAFVAGGFEHSVANMFFLPFGALVATEADALAAAGLTAADVSRLDAAGISQNLVAVTLGNIVGGVIVGLADWTVHLRRRAVAAAAAKGDGSTGT